MKHDPKWYVLSILLLMLLVIVLPRMISLRTHTADEMRDVCFEVYDQCVQLANRKATEQEWLAFEQVAMPRLVEVAEEIERQPSDSLDAWKYYQTARHDIPAIIKGRKLTKHTSRIEEMLAMDPNHYDRMPAVAAANSGMSGAWIPRFDPVIVCVLFLDAAMIVYLWRNRRWFWKGR